MKKIILAFDSFKGTLTALEACESAKKGIIGAFSDAKCVIMPICDGGEGTIDCFYTSLGGRRISALVTAPDFKQKNAEYLILDDGTAVIEMAAASGFCLVEKKDGANYTSRGTGELILHAARMGCKKIVVGIGGSATCDGGAGAALALGARFMNEAGDAIIPTGNGLKSLAGIDISGLSQEVLSCEIIVASDVTNPLCGADGAVYVYGPQKGIAAEELESLDKAFEAYGEMLNSAINKDISHMPGAGAAGGIGAMLMALLSAEMRSGIDMFLDICEFESHDDAALIMTGEGKTDAQSVCGKAVSGVAERAKRMDVPCVVISGCLEKGFEPLYDKGVKAAVGLFSGEEDFDFIIEHTKQRLGEEAAKLSELTFKT